MFESVKKAINREGASDKKSKSNVDAKNPPMTSFGGLNKNQIDRQIASGTSGSLLVVPKIALETQTSLKEYNTTKEKSPSITVASNASFAEVIATIFSEGELHETTEKLKSYINKNSGAVDQRFWYMLMDVHQVSNNKVAFEKVAMSFASFFDTSPPSWQSNEFSTDKKNMMAGKNILILEPQIKPEHTDKFKEFLKAAKEEKFCRINVSQCKFEQNDLNTLVSLYKLFVELRKSKVMAVLMGDNNLINFCKSYINPVDNPKLRPELLANESFFWLLYLEILQWKGKNEEFENLAFDYAVKFEISPPGWDHHGVMSFDKSNELEEDNLITVERVLTHNNIQSLLDIIENDFKQSNKSEIELSHVERIDFASAGSITHFIMELWSKPEYSDKKVIFKHPNEMILILLEMVGVTEFVQIIPKIR